MTDQEGQPLQFDSAEPSAGSAEDVTCAVCKNAIVGSYHMANQAVICANCRKNLETEMASGSSTGRFGRALLFGLGGALVGAGIYYAVLAITDLEIGLIAIVVGWLVGLGVSKGSRGRGGWVYQTLAVALTYSAIVSTYVPFIIQGFREQSITATKPDSLRLGKLDSTNVVFAADSTDGAAARSLAPAAASDSAAKPVVDAEPKPTMGQMVLAFAVLFALAAAAPFLAGMSNIVGLLIIGFALYQAWKMNKKVTIALTGPYQVGTTPA